MTNLPRSRTARRLLALLALLAIVGVAFVGGRASTPEHEEVRVSASGPLGDQARREPGDPLAIGPVDAPVTMVMFSDFRCPFCARFSRVTEPELVDRYVESGRLRIEWRDLPVFGEPSLLAARAGRAAAAQGRFWAFARAVYEAAPERGHPDLTATALRDFAVQAGVPDLQRFEEEMASSVFDEAIAADAMEARALGLTGTPSFVIDGHPIVGAHPTPVFVDLIERTLATKRP